MQPKSNQKLFIFISITLCVVLLALIRGYEADLFYDPFLYYFKSDYLNLPFPKFDTLTLFFSLLIRYLLNSSLSIAIIYLLFKDVELTKFATLIYIFLFVVLIVMFFGIINFFDEKSNFLLFYVRRFIIQPLFLVLFIPAFYFQKKQS